MEPLALVRLDRLMEHSSGRPEIVIGLIDGPVAMSSNAAPSPTLIEQVLKWLDHYMATEGRHT
jgi:hypothetical protein